MVYRNRNLYHPADPVGAAIRRALAAQLPENSVILLVSPLLFYGVDILLQRLPSDSHLLCVEIDEALMALSVRNADPKYLKDPRITYVRTVSADRLRTVVSELESTADARRCCLVSLSGGYGLYRREYDGLLRAVEDHIQRTWRNRMSVIRMGRRWVSNVFQNIAALEPRPASPPRPRRVPLVVGAGESVERFLADVPDPKSHFYIIAVDTALPVLAKNGVHPHAVVAVEGQLINYLDFLGHIDDMDILLYDLASHPLPPRIAHVPKIPFITRFTETRFFDLIDSYGLLPQTVPPLGSVGVTAVLFATSLTQGPVFVTGLDFAYVPGKPHARGAASHALLLGNLCRTTCSDWYDNFMLRPQVSVTNVAGESVTSDAILSSYAGPLADVISSAAGRVYCYPAAGPSVGITPVGTVAEMMSVVRQGGATGDVEQHTTRQRFFAPKHGLPAHARRSSVTAFLRDQRERLLTLQKDIERYIVGRTSGRTSGPTSMHSTSEILAELAELDYIQLDFPDAAPGGRSDKGYLARCAAAASYYGALIDRLPATRGRSR